MHVYLRPFTAMYNGYASLGTAMYGHAQPYTAMYGYARLPTAMYV